MKHTIFLNGIFRTVIVKAGLFLLLTLTFKNVTAKNMVTDDSLKHLMAGIYIGQPLQDIVGKMVVNPNDKRIQEEIMPCKAEYRIIQGEDTIYFNVSDSVRVSSIFRFIKTIDKLEAELIKKYGNYTSKTGMSVGSPKYANSVRGWTLDSISILLSTDFYGKNRIVLYNPSIGKDFLMDTSIIR